MPQSERLGSHLSLSWRLLWSLSEAAGLYLGFCAVTSPGYAWTAGTSRFCVLAIHFLFTFFMSATRKETKSLLLTALLALNVLHNDLTHISTVTVAWAAWAKSCHRLHYNSAVTKSYRWKNVFFPGGSRCALMIRQSFQNHSVKRNSVKVFCHLCHRHTGKSQTELGPANTNIRVTNTGRKLTCNIY